MPPKVKGPAGRRRGFVGRAARFEEGVGVGNLELYKRGQGKYTRIITLLAVVGVGAIGAVVLSEKLGTRFGPLLQFGIPVLVLMVLAVLMLWVVNRPKSADFLIATEGEMKKVSWSSRKEVTGSTKVVIVTTLIMSSALYGVDVLFTWLFQKLGIMG